MSDENNIVLIQLREMREENAEGFKQIKSRLATLEHAVHAVRRDLANFGEGATAQWEDIDALKDRLKALESEVKQLKAANQP